MTPWSSTELRDDAQRMLKLNFPEHQVLPGQPLQQEVVPVLVALARVCGRVLLLRGLVAGCLDRRLERGHGIAGSGGRVELAPWLAPRSSDTSTLRTPGTPSSTFFTLRTQPAQVMPSTFSVTISIDLLLFG